MTNRLGLGNEVRELKIGESFTNPRATGFHTIKYDFKPASVDTNKIATVDVGSSNQVTVTVPHLDGAGVPCTVFKGSQRPYQKECVLIVDRITGEITLEKLSSNIQVKKTRSEIARPSLPQERSQTSNEKSSTSSSSSLKARSLTPPMGRISNRTKVTSGSRRPDRPITNLVPKHSPLHASPNYPSPGHLKSPKNTNVNDLHPLTPSIPPSQGSLPMIDSFLEPPSHPAPHHHRVPPPQPPLVTVTGAERRPPSTDEEEDPVGEISNSSSSSSSDSDSESDLDGTVIERTLIGGTQQQSNGVAGGSGYGSLSVPTELLNEDLCLSEDSE